MLELGLATAMALLALLLAWCERRQWRRQAARARRLGWALEERRRQADSAERLARLQQAAELTTRASLRTVSELGQALSGPSGRLSQRLLRRLGRQPAPVVAAPPTGAAAMARLQRLEARLTAAYAAAPQRLSREDFLGLRYALGLARLERFAPGAARGEPGRAEIDIDPALLAPLRARLLARLEPVLTADADPDAAVETCGHLALDLIRDAAGRRQSLLACHAGQFGAEDLDAEAGQKTLVLVCGSAGGAAHGYPGAFARLVEAGLNPAYIVGAGSGAWLGGLLAQRRSPEPTAIAELFAGQDRQMRFSPAAARVTERPALLDIRAPLPAAGGALRLADLEIPFDAVIGGLRRDMLPRLPQVLGAPVSGRRLLSSQLAERLPALACLTAPDVVEARLLGREDRDLALVDVIGHSLALPGVLAYRTPYDPVPWQDLAAQQSWAGLLDGGLAAALPARETRAAIRGGRLGTRNVHLLALDAFTPAAVPGDRLWLWPLAQAVDAQRGIQLPHVDQHLVLEPALSPLALWPGPAARAAACRRAYAQMDAALVALRLALEPAELPAGFTAEGVG